MESRKGYYSLIQYCPDPSRAEAATIGVALFCPAAGFADARIAESNRRIRRFFGPTGFDSRQLNVQKQSIQARVQRQAKRLGAIEDIERFIATFANELTLTMPRPMKVGDPEHDLADLHAQLVGDGDGKLRRPHRIPLLDDALRQPRFAHKVLRRVPVTVPIFNTQIHIPYAYQNGRLNLIKPEQFPQDAKQAMAKAMQLATEGDLLYKHPDTRRGERQLVVIAAFQPEIGADLPDHVSQVLDAYNTRTVPESRISQLLAEIEEQARSFAEDGTCLDDA
jgi:hypothetical protein